MKEKNEMNAVKAAVAQFYTALNMIFTGDLEPMKAAWSHADDVTYMGPGGGFRKGWEEVLADWQAQAALNLRGRVKPEDMQITTGEHLAVAQSYVQGENVDAQGNPVKVSIRASVLLRKENGVWKIIGVHTDLLPLPKK